LPALAWFARITTLTTCATWAFAFKYSELETYRPGAADLPRQAFYILKEVHQEPNRLRDYSYHGISYK